MAFPIDPVELVHGREDQQQRDQRAAQLARNAGADLQADPAHAAEARVEQFPHLCMIFSLDRFGDIAAKDHAQRIGAFFILAVIACPLGMLVGIVGTLILWRDIPAGK